MRINRLQAYIIALLTVGAIPSVDVTAQPELNELTVDRPGIAESPYTLQPGTYQFEIGFDYYDRLNEDLFFLPVMLFRTGLTKNAELRITTKYVNQNAEQQHNWGLAPVFIGLKVHLVEKKGAIPEIDLLTDIYLPIGSNEFRPPWTGHDIVLLFENDFGKKISFNYNIGMMWNGETPNGNFISAFCLNHLTSSRINLFIEYFNIIPESNTAEHGVDAGLTWRLAQHVQTDLSAGMSTLSGFHNYFLSTGLTIRI
jgi:hypothetical protein